MPNIYSYNSDFEREQVMDKIIEINAQLEEEEAKPNNERDSDKEFKLIYQQFIQGLKLSTGNKF